jgi:hypothetical protein
MKLGNTEGSVDETAQWLQLLNEVHHRVAGHYEAGLARGTDTVAANCGHLAILPSTHNSNFALDAPR